MSHFFGILKGASKSPADRRGSRTSGITAELGTRQTQLVVRIGHDGEDRYEIYMRMSNGDVKAVASGPLS